MEVRAVGKYIRVSPRKVQKVVELIRGKPVAEAINILNFTPKQSARQIKKILESAIANAENNFDLDSDTLYVKRALVNTGPTLKRIKPRARGRADLIRKRTSHITIVLDNEIIERGR
ncbi:50S ribosomal protein L22 [Candidatus Aerophobetes bacterium]|uniref:Large ribosomal subunit protein uL22 n=1 Tax=Aerophobetes bacterium TaxID=2030807 RepID=A0A497E5R9_UNCAE|nr:MAG: 50S ribosomal protein L22 [Candidatus Aerophobetes bacterium]